MIREPAQRRGVHDANRLTDVLVRRQNLAPGRYPDGGCLYLEVEESDARRWLLRLVVNGKRRDMSLGPVRDIPLAEAREKAREARRMAREGSSEMIASNLKGQRVALPGPKCA